MLSSQTINHPQRQQLLLILQNSRTTLGGLHQKLNLDLTLVLFHLSVLQKVHLVATHAEGLEVVYSVNSARLKQLCQKAAERLCAQQSEFIL
jgi:predicted transcriptional regulator